MDAFNDHINTSAVNSVEAHRPVPKRHYLRSWGSQMPVATAGRRLTPESHADEQARGQSGSAAVIQRLAAGQAVTLRAKALSVLRITHGRVWVTLTEAGPYSRVIAGDHFLSRGDSLTLLPGQALVMEPFGRGDMASAQFSWGAPGAAAVAQVAAVPNWRGDVMQPLLDLRHAGALAARAMGRLVLGLGHAAVAEVERVATYVAMIFVADGAGKTRAKGSFNTASRDAGAPCRPY